MKTPRLIADIQGGTGSLRLPDDWWDQGALLRADLLKDWLHDLSVEYDMAVAEAFPTPKSETQIGGEA